MGKNIGLIHSQCADERKAIWQQANKNTKICVGGYCKLAVSEGDTTEHLWVLVTEVGKACYTGTISNDPFLLQGIKFGDFLSFQHHQIEDYLKD